MKKILLTTSLFAALAVMFTSCLKDKGFDNGLYGINDPDTQPPGVGFPRAAAAKYTIGVDLSSVAQTVTGVVYINLESGKPASSDVHITMVLNDALRTAYNTANGTNILAMPTALFSVPLSLTIPAGQRNAQVAISLPNTSTLDPNNTYGFGVTISTVDGGYVIASNLKNLFIEVGLKNKYDGRWNLKGIHTRVPYNFPFNNDMEMWTTGPSSVALYFPQGGDFGQIIGVAPGVINWYGPAVSPNFQFNPATNLCTGVTGMPANAVTLDMVTFDPVIGPIVNRFEPGPPKKMYLTFQYNGNPLRRFYDTLTYLGPR
jgi:hypothetical protein